jgi:hypothetical protein
MSSWVKIFAIGADFHHSQYFFERRLTTWWPLTWSAVDCDYITALLLLYWEKPFKNINVDASKHHSRGALDSGYIGTNRKNQEARVLKLLNRQVQNSS